jgi:mono/diheme cytochrome c family protein
MTRRSKALLSLIVILGAGVKSQGQNVASGKVAVTAVTGESWLNHLHRPFAETSMGKTWRLGPPPPETATELQSWRPLVISNSESRITLHGSDLYRLNCRGCHGESGEGAPPEINSVINPVRATSVAAVMERMKSNGFEVSRADATKMAQQARIALIQRLHGGGENMPAFQHLSQAEIRSLIAYLKELAGISGAENEQTAVNETPVRIGELIVKSTCHICHSAVGSNPTREQLLNGAIPPLSSLATRVSEEGLIRKVTYGAPIAMGTPPTLYRGRMPVFDYLSQQEAADVYRYLATYPPSQAGTESEQIILSERGPTFPPAPPNPGSASGAELFASNGEQPVQASSGLSAKTVILLVGMCLFVFLLLGGGLAFTIYEFKRLSAESARRRITATNAYVLRFPARQREPAYKVPSVDKAAFEKVAR